MVKHLAWDWSAPDPQMKLFVLLWKTWTGSQRHPSLLWRHNGHSSVSNHQPHDCLHNRLFRRRSKLTSKLRVTGLCVGNSPGTGEFPAQMASNAENASIWWRHHDLSGKNYCCCPPQLAIQKLTLCFNMICEFNWTSKIWDSMLHWLNIIRTQLSILHWN